MSLKKVKEKPLRVLKTEHGPEQTRLTAGSKRPIAGGQARQRLATLRPRGTVVLNPEQKRALAVRMQPMTLRIQDCGSSDRAEANGLVAPLKT